jgi:hypothetical protein
MTGAWDDHHGALTEPKVYGTGVTYGLAARWMRECPVVEDWGCGGGGLSAYIEPERYVGVDSSASPWATHHEELAERKTRASGIVMRHVLEHNYGWEDILKNAAACFDSRLCVILFTPLVNSTRVLHTEPDYDNVPVIAFALQDILGPILDAGANVRAFHETLASADALYGHETVIYALR